MPFHQSWNGKDFLIKTNQWKWKYLLWEAIVADETEINAAEDMIETHLSSDDEEMVMY